ncbi:MAG: hypothetical protein ACRDOM_01975 [Nocardioides sp.]
MSVLFWLLLLLVGFGGSMSGEDYAVESEVEEMPLPSATAMPEVTPENGFADPFPDDLGVPTTNREIQERFATRWQLPSCGAVDPAMDEAFGDKGWQCLQDAVGGKEGAELVVLEIGEGRPISTTTYRVNPDGPLEIFVAVSDVPGTAPVWEDYRQCQPSQDLRTEPCAS